MRYVDWRFGGRLRGGLGWSLGAALLMALTARFCGTAGWLPSSASVSLELLAGALMLGALVVYLPGRRVLAGALGGALAVSAVLAPIHTLLALAVAHNFTPLAFLADALQGRERRRVLAGATALFVGGPLLIATGLPYAALAGLGLAAPELSPFQGVSLGANLAVYVPREFHLESWAVHAFSAAVFAQCLHYMAVILVLPRLVKGEPAGLVRWPGARTFFIGLAVAAAALAAGYFLDFSEARRVYAFAALLHSWIEIPILVLALAGTGAAAAAVSAARR